MNAWIFGVILLELLVVSWIDIKTKKISNFWFVINLLLAGLLFIIFPESFTWNWQSLIFPTSWVLFGFVLFAFNIMGAGDSKFLASLFIVIPLVYQILMLEKLLYATIVVGVVFLSFKIFRDFAKLKAYALSAYWVGLKESIRSNFSFAPVILLAWLMLGFDIWN